MSKFYEGQVVTRVWANINYVVRNRNYIVNHVGETTMTLKDLNGRPLDGGYVIDGFKAAEETLYDDDDVVPTKATNPKEAIGDTKLNLSLVPDSMSIYAATAFTEGALKYGSYNWRSAGVRASTYVAACRRHVAKWWNGERCDPKTQVHHLANAMACLAIILDAEVVGKLTDDRPPKAHIDGLIANLEGTVKHLKDMSAGLTPHHYTEAEDGSAE